MILSKTGSGALAFSRSLAYTGLVVIPSLFVALGCGSEPAPPPPEATDTDVEDLKVQMEGIEFGTEVSPPPNTEGGESDSSSPGLPMEEEGEN